MLERLHFVLGGCVGKGTKTAIDCSVELKRTFAELLLLFYCVLIAISALQTFIADDDYYY